MTRRRLPLLCLCAVATVASCIQLSVDPKAIGSIEFVAPTNPSVVVGDTLRDASGRAERLRANVYAADGAQLTDIPVTFVNTDSLLKIVGGMVVTRRAVTGTAKLFAVAGGLQSISRNLDVILRPDSIAPSRALDSVLYVPSASGTAIDTSRSVAVVVRSGSTPVNSVRVAFSLERRGVVLAAGDTLTYALLNALGRVSMVDTTDGAGVASRIFRVRSTAGTVLRDTIVVRATVALGGPPLGGAPATMTVVVRPKP